MTLREILEPHFTDSKGVVYSQRLDQAEAAIKQLVDEKIEKILNDYEEWSNGDIGFDPQTGKSNIDLFFEEHPEYKRLEKL